MRKIKIELIFDEKKLGEKWMNPDNLALLLYSKLFTKKDLLQVVSYEEVDMKKCKDCGKQIASWNKSGFCTYHYHRAYFKKNWRKYRYKK